MTTDNNINNIMYELNRRKLIVDEIAKEEGRKAAKKEREERETQRDAQQQLLSSFFVNLGIPIIEIVFEDTLINAMGFKQSEYSVDDFAFVEVQPNVFLTCAYYNAWTEQSKRYYVRVYMPVPDAQNALNGMGDQARHDILDESFRFFVIAHETQPLVFLDELDRNWNAHEVVKLIETAHEMAAGCTARNKRIIEKYKKNAEQTYRKSITRIVIPHRHDGDEKIQNTIRSMSDKGYSLLTTYYDQDAHEFALVFSDNLLIGVTPGYWRDTRL